MISLSPCPDLFEISHLRTAYRQGLSAPMDGMWDTGIIPQAAHWHVESEGERAGYVAVSDEGALLQFYLLPAFRSLAHAVLEHVIAEDTVRKAVASTIDPAFLSMCLDQKAEMVVHTLLYHVDADIAPESRPSDGPELSAAGRLDLDRIVAFQKRCLNSDHDLGEWLQSYSGNLIARGELYVLHRGNDWIGLGELRKSDSQPDVADLGMMVAPTCRGQGWGSPPPAPNALNRGWPESHLLDHSRQSCGSAGNL